MVLQLNCTAQYFGILRSTPPRHYKSLFSGARDGEFNVVCYNDETNPSNILPRVTIYNYQDTLLQDSVLLRRGFYPSFDEPLRIGNKLLWAARYVDTTKTALSQCVGVLELDSSLNFISFSQVTPYTGFSCSALKLLMIGGNYFCGQSQNAQGNYTSSLFKLDNAFKKIDSVAYETLLDGLQAVEGFISVKASGLDSICKHVAGTSQKLLLDTAFNVISCHSMDSLTTYQVNGLQTRIKIPSNRYPYIVPLSKTKTLLLGNQSISYDIFKPPGHAAVLAIVDENNDRLWSAVQFSPNAPTSFVDIVPYYTIRSKDILVVACNGYDWSQLPFSQSQATRILLTKLDTNGKVSFVRQYGGERYYFPRAVLFTSAGSAVIAGLRSRTDAGDPNALESFLLKIDLADPGNGTGLSDVPRLSCKLYPNPAADNLNVTCTESFYGKISVIDIYGKVVREFQENEGEKLDLSSLEAGFYIVKLRGIAGEYTSKIHKL